VSVLSAVVYTQRSWKHCRVSIWKCHQCFLILSSNTTIFVRCTLLRHCTASTVNSLASIFHAHDLVRPLCGISAMYTHPISLSIKDKSVPFRNVSSLSLFLLRHIALLNRSSLPAGPFSHCLRRPAPEEHLARPSSPVKEIPPDFDFTTPPSSPKRAGNLYTPFYSRQCIQQPPMQVSYVQF
jgi:hypothetical protein